MKRKEAVFIALGELGDGTSVPTLQERASEVYGQKISYQGVVYARRCYRKIVGKVRDCRTLKDQPGRDEKDAFQVNKAQLRRLFIFEATKEPTADDLLKLVGKSGPSAFHSIDQLRNTIAGVKKLKVIKPFSIPKPSAKH